MSDNQIHKDIGYIKGLVEGIVGDVAEIKTDIKENVTPVIEAYKRDRNFIIGICFATSAFFGALFGGLGKAIVKSKGIDLS